MAMAHEGPATRLARRDREVPLTSRKEADHRPLRFTDSWPVDARPGECRNDCASSGSRHVRDLLLNEAAFGGSSVRLCGRRLLRRTRLRGRWSRRSPCWVSETWSWRARGLEALAERSGAWSALPSFFRQRDEQRSSRCDHARVHPRSRDARDRLWKSLPSPASAGDRSGQPLGQVAKTGT
jgi:hypothetical protein